MKDSLNPGLLNTLMDFMDGRKFIVRNGAKESTIRSLDRGCVQGSVLGPALFSHYCRELATNLDGSTVTSYADDSYVITTSNSMQGLIQETRTTMEKHFNYLDSLGMVVNKAKTELMFMNNKKVEVPLEIMVTNESIPISSSLKVLGVTFDKDMKWNSHVANLVKKSQRMISGLKIIRSKMNQEQIMKVITSQYFGALYYGISVWYDALLKKDKQKLDVLHYKALRVAVKDWGRLYPRDMLDTLGRALPNAFAKYSLGSVIMTIVATRFPMRLYNVIMENHFTTRRNSMPQFFDNSAKKVGRQSLRNRMKTLTEKLGEDWTKHKTKESIRRYLKGTFFNTL